MRSAISAVILVLIFSIGAFSDDVYVPSSHVDEVTFSIELFSNRGVLLEATITRRMSVETIPFWVEYTVDDPEDAAEYKWTLYTPNYSTQHKSGRIVSLLPMSNAKDLTLSLRIVIDGISYRWEETIDFPLHSRTEILLDAALFGVGDSESVSWTAHNWTPDDAITFPILEPLSGSTLLVSEWPNVIYISCSVGDGAGATIEYETEAVVYWRDGPPFEIRGVVAMYQGGLTDEQLDAAMSDQFPLLSDLGVNLIVHHHLEWFDAPDANGVFDIHPLYRTWFDEWPEEGFTPPLDQLTTYLERAAQEGFATHIQILHYPYPGISSDYGGSGYGTHEGFMNTEGWHATLREHFKRTIGFFSSLEIDGLSVVGSMTLGAEQGWVIDRGGATFAGLQKEIFDMARAPLEDGGFAFSGSLAFAPSYTHNSNHPNHLEERPIRDGCYTPSRSGVYWEGQDRLELTFYPSLTYHIGASIQDMQDEMMRQVETYLVPFSETHGGKSIFLVDVQCSAVEGAGIWPIGGEHADDPYDPVEQLNWYTAILRGIAAANQSRQEPLFVGLGMGYYGVMPDVWMENRSPRWGVKAPYVNKANNRRDLQLLMKAYYADKPVVNKSD